MGFVYVCVCVLDVYEGCVCTYVCEWCMCAHTRVSKKISVDRCLDQRLENNKAAPMVRFSLCLQIHRCLGERVGEKDLSEFPEKFCWRNGCEP